MSKDAPHSTHSTNIQVGVIAFENASTALLEDAARRIAPGGRLRKPGYSAERYRSHLAGRAVLGDLLERAGIKALVASNPEFGYLRLLHPSGSPMQKLHVNISHTGVFAAAVVGEGSVGIDVESVTRTAERAVVRVADPSEVEAAGKRFSGDVITPTIAVWSAKEAVSKATGLGITFGMRHFIVDFTKEEPFPVHIGMKGPLELRDPAVRMLFWKGYVISICAERDKLLVVPKLYQ